MSYPLDRELAVIAAQLPTLDLTDLDAARVEESRLRALRPPPDLSGTTVEDRIVPGRPAADSAWPTRPAADNAGPPATDGAGRRAADNAGLPAADGAGRRAADNAGPPAADGAGRPGADNAGPGQPDVAVRVYRPLGAASGIGILDVHGGGFVLGGLFTSAAACADLARELGAVVVSVDYRLAPEHPYPAALHDCAAALDWLVAHAADLGVDPDRIAVHGISAGAGLAAGLALLARDRGGPAIAHLYLGCPELDDRQDTASMVAFTDTPVWTRAKARVSWDAYLGPGVAGSPDVEPYAAPARATDLAGLPPTYISAMSFDPLRDEAFAFAGRLLAAGVPVEFHLFPGTFHGSYQIDCAVSRRELRERTDAMRHALTATTQKVGQP